MSENLKNLGNLKEKKIKIQSCAQPTDLPDNWPGALAHLAIGLVDNKDTKLGKIGEKVLLILGLAHINLPLCFIVINLRYNACNFFTNSGSL